MCNKPNQTYSGQTLLPAHMTYKKDSGYGSQGQLKLEALRLSSGGLLSNSQVQMKMMKVLGVVLALAAVLCVAQDAVA